MENIVQGLVGGGGGVQAPREVLYRVHDFKFCHPPCL